MNAQESAMLCRYVRACCPQQRFDEFTPDAWLDLLGDLPFGVAKAAAAAVAKRRPFVAPSEIRTAAGALRAAARKAVRPEVEAADPEPAEFDDFRAWTARTRQAVAALADERISGGFYDLTPVDPFDTELLYTPQIRPVSNLRSITQ